MPADQDKKKNDRTFELLDAIVEDADGIGGILLIVEEDENGRQGIRWAIKNLSKDHARQVLARGMVFNEMIQDK